MARKGKPGLRTERPLSRDDRVKIDADPEDALRALVKPRSAPRKSPRPRGK